MGNSELIKAIVHYQQCLEKYTSRNDGSRMLYCISKLYKMPITVEHLEETGVGRTVNALRKMNGEIGTAAKSLVAKWKEMVSGGPATNDSTIKTENSKSHKNELKEKYREKSSASSHKEGDTRNKYEEKVKSSTSSYNEEEPVYYHGREKEETKHRKHEKQDRKDKESRIHKHKSSKRRHESDHSESEESSHENTDEDDDDDDDSKHKSSKSKDDDSSNEEEEYYHKVKKDKDSRRHKSSKRKRDEDDSESEREEVNVRHKKYSEENQSEEDNEEIEIKKRSSKHHRQKEEHKRESREKSKYESKHKEKKIEKEYTSEDNTKRDASSKTKDKHSSKDKAKTSSSSKKHREDKSPDKKSKHNSSKHHSKDKEHKSKNSSSHSGKGKISLMENGIDSGSGASFAEALGMIGPSSSKTNKKKIAVIHPFPVEKPKVSKMSPEPSRTESISLLAEKKLEPLDINVANLLPEITPNYRPLGNAHMDNGHKNKIINDDEALFAILNAKISRTKVYSGNKVIWGKVPTLFDLCTHVLQDNIDALEYTGGVPFSILKPVLERASADQLFTLEHHNPYLIEDTDELWQFHCGKEFRTKRREEMETWRDMYMRCLDEREAKLKALTANIKQSQDKSLPVRQTKLAYVDSIVKPPRAILRKQAKHGTGGSDKKPLVTPSSRLSTLATAGAAGQVAVPNPGARASTTSGNSSASMKVKKAPLMQKTLALMKNRCFRR